MFSWFPLIVGKDAEGKDIKHPAFQGTERVSVDGTMFLMHDEIAIQRGCELAEEDAVADVPIGKDTGMLVGGKGELTLEGDGATFVAPEFPMKAIMTKSMVATKEWTDIENMEIAEVTV